MEDARTSHHFVRYRILLGAVLGGLLFGLPLVPERAPVAARADLMDMVAGAKDCHEGRGCDLKLTPGAPHGAGFVHYLALAFKLDKTVDHARMIAAVLLGLAFALLVLSVARCHGEVAGYCLLPLMYLAPSLGLYLGRPCGFMFWNPTLIPLASCLFLAGACRYLARARLRDLAFAALGASLGPYFHLAAGVLLPALFVLVLLNSRKNLTAAVMTAGLVVLLVAQWGYATVVLDHAQWFWGATGSGEGAAALQDGGRALLARCLPALALTLAVIIALRAPGAPLERRCTLFLLTTHLPFYLTLIIFGVSEAEHDRYGLALSPGMALLVVLTALRLSRMFPFRPQLATRIAPHAALALLVLLGGHRLHSRLGVEDDPHVPREPTIGDVRAIAARLGAEGWTRNDIAERLQGNSRVDAGPMREAIVTFDELLAPPGRRAASDQDVEVILARTAELAPSLPASFELVGERVDLVVMLRRFTPLVRWDDYVACDYYPQREAQSACRCRRVKRTARYESHLRDRWRLSNKLFLRTPSHIEIAAEPHYLVVRAPLTPLPERAPRELVIPAQSEAYPCEGAFLEVGAAASAEAMPATFVVAGADGAAGGELLVAWELSSASCRAANDPPLPTVLDREPKTLTVPTAPPARAFQDPHLRARLVACARGEAARTARVRENGGAQGPEALVPSLHVGGWGILLALMLVACGRGMLS